VFALKDVSFTVNNGERIALIGANGAGKSTLLLSLVGVLTPVSGEIRFCEDATHALILSGNSHSKETLRRVRRKIGMVFQNPDDQLFMPSVKDDIEFGLRNAQASEDEIEAKTAAVLASLGIAHLKDRMSHRLSDGEKRLAGLAGVLAMEPSMLLLDEPFTFLDPKAHRNLTGILSRLPHAMMLATHDLDLAGELCDRAIILKDGMVFADGAARELLGDTSLLEAAGL
jgi:cobalt/nickel transport system ATP-binding protein